jgi:hypothetical protein
MRLDVSISDMNRGQTVAGVEQFRFQNVGARKRVDTINYIVLNYVTCSNVIAIADVEASSISDFICGRPQYEVGAALSVKPQAIR